MDTHSKLATKARFCQARYVTHRYQGVISRPSQEKPSSLCRPHPITQTTCSIRCLNTYIHVGDSTSRCVRRAFLCGEDAHTGQSYEHRRQWIEERMFSLGKTFSLDICAYAVMPNHYHMVLHMDKEQAEGWSKSEVIQRWHQLFTCHPLTLHFLAGKALLKTELNLVAELVTLWRSRLMDISWFMRCLNESIARQANEEDNCTGRFYERHPWRSPFGPASLFRFAPGKSVGEAIQIPGATR